MTVPLPVIRSNEALLHAAQQLEDEPLSVLVCMDALDLNGLSLLCSRGHGHDGPHTARGSDDRVYAIWPVDGWALRCEDGTFGLPVTP